MSWKEPKVNWKAGDAPTSDDFNRIEGNISYERENGGKVDSINGVKPDVNKNVKLKSSDIGAVSKGGDSMNGILKGYSNSNYTTAQFRNITLSTEDPSSYKMDNGDIWIKYR